MYGQQKQNKINFVDKLNISAIGFPEHPLINIHSIASSLFRRAGTVSTIIDLALNTFMYLSWGMKENKFYSNKCYKKLARNFLHTSLILTYPKCIEIDHSKKKLNH